MRKTWENQETYHHKRTSRHCCGHPDATMVINLSKEPPSPAPVPLQQYINMSSKNYSIAVNIIWPSCK